MNASYRVVALAVLLIATFGLCVGYATADHWEITSGADVATNPAAHDGEEAFVFAEVIAVDDQTASMTVQVDSSEVEVNSGDPASLEAVEPGSDIQVYGTLDGGSTAITAEEVVIDYRNDGDRAYVYGTSVLGGLLAAGYFRHHWTIDLRRLGFSPRGERDG